MVHFLQGLWLGSTQHENDPWRKLAMPVCSPPPYSKVPRASCPIQQQCGMQQSTAQHSKNHSEQPHSRNSLKLSWVRPIVCEQGHASCVGSGGAAHAIPICPLCAPSCCPQFGRTLCDRIEAWLTGPIWTITTVFITLFALYAVDVGTAAGMRQSTYLVVSTLMVRGG